VATTILCFAPYYTLRFLKWLSPLIVGRAPLIGFITTLRFWWYSLFSSLYLVRATTIDRRPPFIAYSSWIITVDRLYSIYSILGCITKAEFSLMVFFLLTLRYQFSFDGWLFLMVTDRPLNGYYHGASTTIDGRPATGNQSKHSTLKVIDRQKVQNPK